MKPPRFVAALTGGIGTGKSSALAEFEKLGASTVSLDQIAKEQARPGRDGWKAIVKAFGREILDGNGNIDRKKLGKSVFRDKNIRLRLDRATHPSILREMKRLISRMHGVVIVDVPLLYEKNLQDRFDASLVVSCRPSTQTRRVARRDGFSPAEARRRIAAQLPLKTKVAKADFTLDNDGTPAQLRIQVRALHAGLSLLYGGTPNGNAD